MPAWNEWHINKSSETNESLWKVPDQEALNHNLIILMNRSHIKNKIKKKSTTLRFQHNWVPTQYIRGTRGTWIWPVQELLCETVLCCVCGLVWRMNSTFQQHLMVQLPLLLLLLKMLLHSQPLTLELLQLLLQSGRKTGLLQPILESFTHLSVHPNLYDFKDIIVKLWMHSTEEKFKIIKQTQQNYIFTRACLYLN